MSYCNHEECKVVALRNLEWIAKVLPGRIDDVADAMIRVEKSEQVPCCRAAFVAPLPLA